MADPTPEEQEAAAKAATAARQASEAKAVQAEEAKKHVLMTHPEQGKLKVHPTTVDAHKSAGWTVAK